MVLNATIVYLKSNFLSIETLKQKDLSKKEESCLKQETAFYSALTLFSAARANTLAQCAESVQSAIYEIRVYVNKCVVFVSDAGPLFCRACGAAAAIPASDPLVLSPAEVYGIVRSAADQALFLHERELKRGYLTKNGCRVGICGFTAEGKLQENGVSSVNIRIPAARVNGKAPPGLKELLLNGSGLLVAGAPGSGKTTFLKRCIALLAGEALGWRRVAVVDERDEFFFFIQENGEILTADVLRGADKAAGIQTALRLFDPEYIVCDEIGSAEETAGLLEGLNSGVRFIASIHAANRAQLMRRRQFGLLWEAGVFGNAVFLSSVKKGSIEDRLTAEAFR